MATKYFCDVCGTESRNEDNLEKVNRVTPKSTKNFDLCSGCAKKMFKNVKEYRYLVKIVIEFAEDGTKKDTQEGPQ